MKFQLVKVDGIQIAEYYNLRNNRNNGEKVLDHDVQKDKPIKRKKFRLKFFLVTDGDQFWILVSIFFFVCSCGAILISIYALNRPEC